MTKHENTLNTSNVIAGECQQNDHKTVIEQATGSRWLEDISRTIRGYAIRTAAPPGDMSRAARDMCVSSQEGKRAQNISDTHIERTTMQTNQKHTTNHLFTGEKNTENQMNRFEPANTNRRQRQFAVSALALMTAFASVQPAWAAIDNSAVAVGTFLAPDDTSSTPSLESVPVVTAARDLTVVKSVSTGPTTANGADPVNTDALDTITYLYIITNDGNVTETNVTPVDTGPTFNGTAPVNSLGAFTEVAGGSGSAASLAPGETVHFEATYTFATLDVLRAAGVTNGVANSATSSSDDHTDTDTSTATATIAAVTGLTITKVAVLNDEINADSLAEVGETITYTYTVENTGNVALTNVAVADTHEGALLVPAPVGETITTEGPVQASDIGVANDGVIDVFEAGAIATFTLIHTVTQTEVDNQ